MSCDGEMLWEIFPFTSSYNSFACCRMCDCGTGERLCLTGQRQLADRHQRPAHAQLLHTGTERQREDRCEAERVLSPDQSLSSSPHPSPCHQIYLFQRSHFGNLRILRTAVALRILAAAVVPAGGKSLRRGRGGGGSSDTDLSRLS